MQLNRTRPVVAEEVLVHSREPWRGALVARLVTGCVLAMLLGACRNTEPHVTPDASVPDPVEIRIFHTSDEHGYLEPQVSDIETIGGAANVAGWMKQRDGFDPAHDLLLSGGDNWIGPAISNLFKGESAVEVFDSMGYAASALGNHDFDLGQVTLAARAAQAGYGCLAANVHYASTGQLFEGTAAYRIFTLEGVAIGVIGLTLPRTGQIGAPRNVGDLVFDPLATTLNELVPQVRSAGADLVVVLAHESYPIMLEMLPELEAKPDVIFSAHDHGYEYSVQGLVPVVDSGSHFERYTVTRLGFDPVARKVVSASVESVRVARPTAGANPYPADPAVQGVVDGWREQLDAALGAEIGYTASGIERGTWAMANWVADAILAAFPEDDIVIQNRGAITESVPAGAITVETGYLILPYEQNLVEVELTGQQVIDALAIGTSYPEYASPYPAVAGVRFSGTGTEIAVMTPDGAPLDPAATYRVIVDEYIYYGGGYSFQDFDATPVDLGINARVPVTEWTRALGTSSADPLEAHIDALPRNE